MENVLFTEDTKDNLPDTKIMHIIQYSIQVKKLLLLHSTAQ